MLVYKQQEFQYKLKLLYTANKIDITKSSYKRDLLNKNMSS